MKSEFQRFQDNIEVIKYIIEFNKNIDYDYCIQNYTGMGNYPFFTLPIELIREKNYDNAQTKKYFDEVRGLLSLCEKQGYEDFQIKLLFKKIAASSLTAYYTEPAIVNSLLSSLIFNNRSKLNESSAENPFRILDPSSGTGVFVNCFIKNFETAKKLNLINSDAFVQIHAIEPEPISFKILKQLELQNENQFISIKIEKKKFEELNVSDNYYDIITSNIPFGSMQVFDEKLNKAHNIQTPPNIHSYFFLKSHNLLKYGGNLAFITSSSFLNNSNTKHYREILFNEAELINLIRLPKETFLGTEVETDYLAYEKTKTPTFENLKINQHLINSVSIPTDSLELQKNPNKNKEQDYNINEYAFLNQAKVYLGNLETNYFHGKYILSSSLQKDKINIALFNNMLYQQTSKDFLRLSHNGLKEVRAAFNKVNTADDNYNFLLERNSSHFDYSKLEQKQTFYIPSLFDDLETENNTIEQENTKAINQQAKIEKDFLFITKDELSHQNILHYTGAFVIYNEQFLFLDDFNNKTGTYLAKPQKFIPEDRDLIKSLFDLKNEYLLLQQKVSQNYEFLNEKILGLYKDFENFGKPFHQLALIFESDYHYSEFKNIDFFDEKKELQISNFLKQEFHRPKESNFITESAEEAFYKTLQNNKGNFNEQFFYSLFNTTIDESQRKVKIEDLIQNNFIALEYNINDENNLSYELVRYNHLLSGNIPKKIEAVDLAIELNYAPFGSIDKNIEYKDKLIESDIFVKDFEDLKISLASQWLPPSILDTFLRTNFDYPGSQSEVPVFKFEKLEGFRITNPFFAKHFQLQDFKLKRAKTTTTGVTLLEMIINNATFNFNTTIIKNGNEYVIKDFAAIKEAEYKAQTLNLKWKSYLNSLDDQTKEKIVQSFNNTFNLYKAPNFNGDYLNFDNVVGINSVHQHQKDCAAMIIENNGGIADHKVGAGKSLIMFYSALKLKELNICKKPVITCLNSTTEQIFREAKHHFPNAKIHFATPKKNRQAMYSEIANKDWDIVIMTHEEFCKIPIPLEIEKQHLEKQLDDLQNNFLLKIELENQKLNSGKLKDLEKRIQSTEEKLNQTIAKLNSKSGESIFNMYNLGIDHVLVDEAHQFKNMPYTTMHGEVAGLSTSDSQRASQMKMLSDAIRHKYYENKDEGVSVFSGTFVTNSVAEFYNLINWISPGNFERIGISTFDQFANNFLEKTKENELAIGNAIKEKERFRYVINLPELKNLYLSSAHIVNGFNFSIPTPNIETQMVICDMDIKQQHFNELLVDFIEGNHSTREQFESIIEKSYDEKQVKAASLIVSNLSSKNGIDARLINNEYFAENPNGKLHKCAKNIKEIYDLTQDHLGVQLVFSDLGVPNDKNPINAYQLLKNLLIEKYGIPSDEIQFANDWKDKKSGTVKDSKLKREFEEKTNSGKFRIVIGGTKTLGTGRNIQKRAIAVHHLDTPWNPSATEQRNGRLKRQGNEIAQHFQNKIFEFKYLSKHSLDAFRSQANENKQKFLNTLKNINLGNIRVLDEGDIDGDGNSTNFTLMKAHILENPKLMDIANLEKKIKTLEILRESSTMENIKINREYNRFLNTTTSQTKLIANYSEIFETISPLYNDFDENSKTIPPMNLLDFQGNVIETSSDIKEISAHFHSTYNDIENFSNFNTIVVDEHVKEVVRMGSLNYQVFLAEQNGIKLFINLSNVDDFNFKNAKIDLLFSNPKNKLLTAKRGNYFPKDEKSTAHTFFNEIYTNSQKVVKNEQRSLDVNKKRLDYFTELKNSFQPFNRTEELDNDKTNYAVLKSEYEIELISKKNSNKNRLD